MTYRSMGEGENRTEYTNKQCKRDRKPVRPNHAMNVCTHNPAKLELQQERKRLLPSQRAACGSERMEEQMNDQSMGQRECKRESEHHCVPTRRPQAMQRRQLND